MDTRTYADRREYHRAWRERRRLAGNPVGRQGYAGDYARRLLRGGAEFRTRKAADSRAYYATRSATDAGWVAKCSTGKRLRAALRQAEDAAHFRGALFAFHSWLRTKDRAKSKQIIADAVAFINGELSRRQR